jgi:hypothetical protein
MKRLRSAFRGQVAVMLFILLGGAIVLPVTAQPDNPLPTPTGPYQVGVTSRQWVDTSRGEIYTADPDDNKVVTVWIWYPADVEEGAEQRCMCPRIKMRPSRRLWPSIRSLFTSTR